MEDVDNVLDQVERIKKGLQELQKDLKSMKVKGKDENGTTTVIVSGEGKILDFKFDSPIETLNKETKNALIEATNNGLEKAKKLESEKKQEIIGDIDMPDIPGL